MVELNGDDLVVCLSVMGAMRRFVLCLPPQVLLWARNCCGGRVSWRGKEFLLRFVTTEGLGERGQCKTFAINLADLAIISLDIVANYRNLSARPTHYYYYRLLIVNGRE
jgi:hypothetical protein